MPTSDMILVELTTKCAQFNKFLQKGIICKIKVQFLHDLLLLSDILWQRLILCNQNEIIKCKLCEKKRDKFY